MSLSGLNPRRVRFAVFELDYGRGELYKHGHRLRIQKQPFEILCALLERPGDVVTREDLRRRLWPDSTFVEYEDSLNTAVRKLRAALSDSFNTPRYIETISRRGYAFIAPVQDIPAGIATRSEPEPDQVGDSRVAIAPLPEHSRRWGPRVVAGVIVAVALVAAAVLTPLFRVTRKVPGSATAVALGATAVAPSIRSLAVLPLENLSSDPREMYFADGMTDELLTELGQINSLRVISRTSVMRYKGVHKPLPEIARELNVDGIVEGTVLKQGDEVRVTAQLVYAPSDRHLWAQSYRGDLHQMLELQSDVANAIATQIRLELRPHERVAVSKDRVLNPKAYESYLRGRLLLNRRTPASLQEAIHLFRAAAAEDPDYGAPLAAMAGSYLLLQQYGAKSSAETLPYAAQAAQQALQLDAMLSGAHAALAVIHSDYEWDWKKAKSEFKRSIDANPNDATAHQWYAEFLAAQGRTADAAAEIQLAQGLDPLSPIIDVVSGEIAFFARDYDRTIAVCRKALAKDSGFAPAYSFIGLAYTQKGDYAAAAEHLKKAVALSHESPMSTSFLGAVYALSGRRQDAESIRVRVVQESARRYVSPVDLAILDIALGARGRAVADIGRAGTAHDHWVTFIKVDPRLDGIRAEPGFATLVRHLGLS